MEKICQSNDHDWVWMDWWDGSQILEGYWICSKCSVMKYGWKENKPKVVETMNIK